MLKGKYSFSVDASGNLTPSTALAVRNFGDNSLATIYDADGAAINQASFTSDSDGKIVFWAGPGTYTLEVGVGASQTKEVFTLGEGFDTVAGLLADTSLAYSPANDYEAPVIVDDIITAGPYQFSVVASGATDNHVETAGGVKLRALVDAGGFVSPAQFSTGLLGAMQSGSPVMVTEDDSGSDISISTPVDLHIAPDVFIDRNITIAGEYAHKTDTVDLTLDWASVPIGTTTLAGDFSAYAANDLVMIELPDAGSAAQGNQTGVDFLTVSSASASSITFTTGTRLPYSNPRVSKITKAAQHTGTVLRGQRVISGDYTAQFSVGDVVRIENTTGTDGVEGSDFYFDINRVKEIDATEIVFEENFSHEHTDPWLVAFDHVERVNVFNKGRIKRLTVKNSYNPVISGGEIDRRIVWYCYRGVIENQLSRGVSEASTSNLTFVWHGMISNVQCGGSLSSTDNAAFKFLGCPNLQATNVSGFDNVATGQGNYAVFGDYFFTPYKVWNDLLQTQNVRGITPKGGSPRSVWITGVRDGSVDVSGGRVFLQRLAGGTAIAKAQNAMVEIQDCVRCAFDAEGDFVKWQGNIQCELNARVRDGTDNSTRAVWALGGSKHPETGASYTTGENNLFNIHNMSPNAADRTIYVQDQDNWVAGQNCRDYVATNSITVGSNATNGRVYPNLMTGAVPTRSDWSGPVGKGYQEFDTDYRGGLVLAGAYFFSDGDTMRVHTSKPTSSSNGSPFGRRVAVPTAQNDSGVDGDWAADSNYFYVYVSSNNWRRTALSTW